MAISLFMNTCHCAPATYSNTYTVNCMITNKLHKCDFQVCVISKKKSRV